MLRKTILIVEDEWVIAAALAGCLEEWGYEVTGNVGTGEKCIEIVRENPPDLILMDITLSGNMDGVTAAAEIQSFADIPVVYITAYDEEAVFQRASETAPYGYLKKPIDVSSLRQTVQTALSKHEADKRVRESEERFRGIFRNAAVGIDMTDVDGRFVLANDALSEMLGYTAHELLDFTFTDVTHPDDRPESSARYEALLDGRLSSYRLEKRFVRKDGTAVWADLSVSPVRDSQGKLTGTMGVVVDITDRKRTEEALRESEERLRASFDTELVAWAISRSKDGVYLEVNPGFLRLTGYSRDEIIGRTSLELGFFTPEMREAMLAELTKEGRLHNREMDFRTKTGDIRTILFSIGPITLGGEASLLAVMVDITDRKRAEEARQESEETTRLLSEMTFEAIAFHDGGYLVDANPQYFEMFGYEPDELIGQYILPKTVSPEHLEEILGYVRDGYTGRYEAVAMKKDGARFPVEVQARLCRFRGRDVRASVIRDITRRKEAEGRLKGSLQEKEVLLREIHHRVKNNLAVISSLLTLQSKYGGGTFPRGVFDDAQARIRSMAVAHELLYQSENFTRVNLPDYVAGLVHHFALPAVGLGSGLNVIRRIDDISFSLDTVIPLGMIITELISNSVKHAFPERRDGEIVTSLHTIGEDEYELTVKDNGVGLPEDVDVEHPRTLGLELVNTFVDQLRGRMEVQRGEGTEIRVRFREARKKTRPPAAKA